MNKFSRIVGMWVVFLFMLPAWAVDLGTGNGVRFSQISYADVPSLANTPVGWMEVDLNLLRNSTGVASGFLNVSTASGWVARNVPVLAETVYPYSRINTRIDLGVPLGTAVTQITATVSYSDTLLTAFSSAPATVFPVSGMSMSIGGGNGVSAGGPVTPPTFTDVLFSNPSANDAIIQYDHPNEQAASNQCAPMSVANSLQYLKDTQGLQLPHEHKMGLKGDNSLVGQLDTAGNRPATSRTVGSGQWLLQTKLNYVAANNLGSKIVTTQWGASGPDSGGADQSVTVNNVTVTAKGKGSKINIDELMQALREGQDCELVYHWGGANPGAHAVDLVGAGKHNGNPWLLVASDITQAGQAVNGDSKGAGPEGFEFEYLGAPVNGIYTSSGGNVIDQVICEKVVPPQVTETVTSVTDPAGHSPFVDPPPANVWLAVNGTTMTLSGNASWMMPMTGTINATGSFSLASTATVAGFSNVTSTFIGALQGNNYIGNFSVGAGGQLPSGQPISWGVSIPRVLGTPNFAMRMNGFRHHLESMPSELLRPSVSVRAGTQAGQSGDWWLAAAAGGSFYHFDLATMSWQPGLVATHTGALGDLPFFALPYLTLPSGEYDFYFGFDSVPDGALTLEALSFEKLRATVQ
jgi:hypothetical protein